MDNKVCDMLGQEITVGAKVLYLRGKEFIPLKSIVKDIVVKKRPDSNIRCIGKVPPLVNITVDCGDIWGIKKPRETNRLLVIDKLDIPNWKLG